jgi:hypothetical protein
MTDYRLAEIGSGLLPVIVTLREEEKLRFLELRLYRKNAETHHLSPTNWTIGLDAGAFTELKIVLDESYEHIQKWFGPRELKVVEKVRVEMAAQAKAYESAVRVAHKVEVRQSAWRGPTFFRARSEGERVVVELNTEHSVAKTICADASSCGLPTRQLLGAILAAYHDAKNRFDGPEGAGAVKFINALEYEWGMILSKYAEASP